MKISSIFFSPKKAKKKKKIATFSLKKMSLKYSQISAHFWILILYFLSHYCLMRASSVCMYHNNEKIFRDQRGPWTQDPLVVQLKKSSLWRVQQQIFHFVDLWEVSCQLSSHPGFHACLFRLDPQSNHH